MSASFLIVFFCVCLYHRDMEIVMDKEIKKIKPLLVFFHFPSVWPAHRQQTCSPFCSSAQLPSTRSVCWCLCVAWHWCGAVCHGLHDGGGLSQQWLLCHAEIKHPKSADGQYVPVLPAATVHVSGAPAFLTATPAPSSVRIITACLLKHLVSQNPLLLQNQQAGPVLPMSVISVVSIWRDDVNFVFPIQTLVTARSRMQDSEVQSTVLRCKPHVCACLLFLNYNIYFANSTSWLVCCSLVAII